MKNFLLFIIFVLTFGHCYSQTQLTNIPTFYIQTKDNVGITSKTEYVDGFLTIVSSDESEDLTADTISIRGRGNSTWNFEKKPYRLKLNKKNNLLNLPAKAKNWVMLANHADKTLIRNAVALKIGSMLNLEFTPAFRFIDVYINNQYQGNYLLTDQVEVDKNRVAVDKQEATMTELPDISGGYLLEIDGFAASEPVWFTTSQGLKVTVKYPKDDEINSAQLNYITTFTQQFEDALFSSDFSDAQKGYRSLVDEVSLIDWYIASELTGNPDCFWSTYIYKKRDEDKLYFGPMWDYDIAFNNDNRKYDASNSLMKDVAFNPRQWIERLCQDPWFVKAVNNRWKELVASDIKNTVLNYIDDVTEEIYESQTKNYEKWRVINRRVYNEPVLYNTYDQYTNFLRNYVDNRVDFLTASFENFTSSLPSEDFTAEDFYYLIFNKRTNNALDIDPDTKNVYLWTPLENADDQNWKITQVSAGTYHIINREYNMALMENGRSNNMILAEPDATNNRQLWRIEAVSTGNVYGIVNVSNNLSVNNNGGSFENGNAAIVYDNRINESLNQQWYIQKVEAIASSLKETENIKFHNLIYNYQTQELTVNLDRVNMGVVSVFSLTGKQVGRFNVNDQNDIVSLEDLQKGIYIVRLNTEDGTQTIKIIK